MHSQDVLWHSPRLNSMEHFRYRMGDRGQRLEGTVLLPRHQMPTTIEYTVVVDAMWRIVGASIHCTGLDGQIDMEATVDEGQWSIDGTERTDLSGCTDIDLGWTPATNTLPIRRTRLEVGETAKVDAAWVTFPELAIRRVEQTYSRRSLLGWTYSSASFTADINTDSNGIVVTYGTDVWTTLASRETGT
jgi:hypothetical protein